MKKILLLAIILWNLPAISQNNKTDVTTKLINKLEQIGTNSGDINQMFSKTEQLLLRNHFASGSKAQKTNNKANSIASTAYASGNNKLVSFIPPSGEITEIGSSGFEHAGAIDPNDNQQAYVLDNTSNFFSINLETGEYTLLGNIPGNWLGAEFDTSAGILYAISDDSSLYTINIANVSATLVGAMGLDILPIALAIDGQGNAYTFDLVSDNFYSINLNTGTATFIGPIGFDANFGQGMFWDEASDTIYITAFNNPIFQSELRTVNTTTGETTFVTNFGGLGDLAPYPWASSTGLGIPSPDPDLFQTWYLTNMNSESFNINVSDIEPSITPSFTISENLDFSGVGACNTFSGNFIYNADFDIFTVENFSATETVCEDDSHNDFEFDYFSYFFDEMYYSIYTGDNEDQFLTLEIPIFASLSFRNYILSNPDFDSIKTKIYPNPVSETLYVSSENNTIKTFIIYSITGEVILEDNNATTNSIDVSSLNQGLYFVEMISSEGKTTKKFIKK